MKNSLFIKIIAIEHKLSNQLHHVFFISCKPQKLVHYLADSIVKVVNASLIHK